MVRVHSSVDKKKNIPGKKGGKGGCRKNKKKNKSQTKRKKETIQPESTRTD